MDILDGLVYTWLHMIAAEAGELVKINKKRTLSSRSVQTAVRLTIPGELKKHAVSEGTKVVTPYGARCVDHSPSSLSTARADIPNPSVKKDKKLKRSRSTRFGLQFPVGRIRTFLKKGMYAPRIGGRADVYLTAVIEYLVAEVLELSGNVTVQNKKTRITARHVMIGIQTDEELNCLIFEGKSQNGGGAIFSGAGVKPNISPFLINKKNQPKKEDTKDSTKIKEVKEK